MSVIHPDQAAAVYRDVAAVRMTAESANRAVVAVAGPFGELRELRIDPRVYRVQDAIRLSADVVEASSAAADRACCAAFDAARVLLPVDAEPVGADLVFGPVLRELDQLAATARERVTVPSDSRPVLDIGIDYEAQRRDLEAQRAVMLETRAAADSDDGLVTTTVDACGRVFGVALHQRVYRVLDSRRLAAQITATAHLATKEARARLRAAPTAPHGTRGGRP